jgi:hypothetical protein
VSVDNIVRAHYEQQQALARTAAQRAQSSWRQIDPDSIAASWRELLAKLLRWLTATQASAALAGASYVERVVWETGGRPRPVGRVEPSALAGIASDGRALDSLLETPLHDVFDRLEHGATVEDALRVGQNDLVRIAATQITDAGRVATSVAMANDQYISGYVRIVHLPACGRCIILAGREYAWSTGFLRHPRCLATAR